MESYRKGNLSPLTSQSITDSIYLCSPTHPSLFVSHTHPHQSLSLSLSLSLFAHSFSLTSRSINSHLISLLSLSPNKKTFIRMNGYSKMRVKRSTPKSRSMDLTGLNFSPLQAQQDPDPPSKPQVHHSPIEEEGERFGVILSRNCSSSASSQRLRGTTDNNDNKMNASALQAVVGRAFSMRKSDSIGDGYWRIHDTADADSEVIQEEEEEMPTTRIKKKGNFFRACKRLFNFST